MMSKSSFLVSMKENNKRRLWVWVISMLAFVLVFPVYTALVVKNTIIHSEWIAESYGLKLTQQMIHEELVFNMANTLGVSALIAVLTTIVAIISAVQGFSYLYSRKKIDFYMGMPVKRKKRFLNIWLNGILLYVIPYLSGLLISILIAAGNGGVDGEVLYAAATAFGINICFYLCVYHMAILAVMLTGNIVITGFALLVFGLYEFGVRFVLYGYKELFFRYFSSYGNDKSPILSPFVMLFDFVNSSHDRLFIAAKLLIFGLVLLVISYVCYKKRPAEAAGKAMTFAITKPIVKVLLVIPLSLLAGFLVAETINYDPLTTGEGIWYVIFTIALVVVVGSAMIQVIYEFDIKGALYKKSHIVVAGVLAALIFMGFRYDFTGYDSYIPKQKDIESIAFVPDYYESSAMYGNGRFDQDGSYMSEQEYADKYMQLKNVEEVCKLAEISQNGYNEFLGRAEQEGYKEEQAENWSYATLIYHLKNGRSVSRVIWVDVNDENTIELLDQIMGSEEFKKGYMAGASENIDLLLSGTNAKRKVSAVYGNTVYTQKMNAKDAESLLEAYRKDLALANFSNIKESTPISEFTLHIEEETAGSSHRISRSIRSWDIKMDIYPFYKESIACLKENGYYMEGQLDLEDVDHIQVLNYNNEAREKLQEKINTTAGAAAIGSEITDEEAENIALEAMQSSASIDTRVYADYTQKEDISRIASCIVPQDITYGSNWDGGNRYDNEYQIIVYFKAGSEISRSYGTYAYYCFLKGQVPDFVAEDTIYKD